MIQLKISGSSFAKVKAYAADIAEVLKALRGNEGKQKNMIQILGPVEASIQKISSRFRWQILVKSPSSALVNRLVKSLMNHPKVTPRSGVRLIVDVDPYFLM